MGEGYVLLMGLSLIWKTKSTLLLTPIIFGVFYLEERIILKNHPHPSAYTYQTSFQ